MLKENVIPRDLFHFHLKYLYVVLVSQFVCDRVDHIIVHVLDPDLHVRADISPRRQALTVRPQDPMDIYLDGNVPHHIHYFPHRRLLSYRHLEGHLRGFCILRM